MFNLCTADILDVSVEKVLKVLNLNLWGLGWPLGEDKDLRSVFLYQMVSQKKVRTQGYIIFDQFKAFDYIVRSHESDVFLLGKDLYFLHANSTCSE